MSVFFSVVSPLVISMDGLAAENAPILAKAAQDASSSLGEASLDKMTAHLKTLAPAFAMREQKHETFAVAYTPKKHDMSNSRDIS